MIRTGISEFNLLSLEPINKLTLWCNGKKILRDISLFLISFSNLFRFRPVSLPPVVAGHYQTLSL